MSSTRYLSIAPDLDALELTLVRSIENIRKTLPQNRGQFQDLSTPSSSFGRNIDRANRIALPGRNAVEHGLVVPVGNFGRALDGPFSTVQGSPASTGPSWKQYIKESEALALELQMESVLQDMRDLERTRQRRQQELDDYGDPTLRQLRRVSEPLPLQKRASYSLPKFDPEGGSLINRTNYLAVRHESWVSNDEGPVGGSAASSFMSNHRNSSASSSEAVRPPSSCVKKPSKISQLAASNHLSKPTNHSLSFSAPGILCPTPVSRPPNTETEHTYRKSSVDSGRSRHDSAESIAGRKLRNSGGKKVRFAESMENNAPIEIYDREPAVLYRSPPTSLSSLSSLSTSSQSLSDISSSLGISQSGLHRTPLNNEESRIPETFLPSRTPLSPLDLMGKRIPLRNSLALTKKTKRSIVNREVKIRDSRKLGPIHHVFEDGKAEEASFKQRQPLGSTREEKIEQNPPPERITGLSRDGVKDFTPGKKHSPPPQVIQYRSNMKASIRSLLRKHSGNLLDKFSWRGSKAGGLPQKIKEESACVACCGVFDTSSLIQVPEKCLHFYCRPCLKAIFTQALKDPHSACSVKCCESNIIDVSLATNLLSQKKIARYKALIASRDN